MLRKFKNSSGSTLAVALFVIVVLGMLAMALARMRVDSSDTHIHAVMYVQAEMAASSALDAATYQLYPLGTHRADPSTLTSSDTADAVGGCDRVSKKFTFSETAFAGLSRCSVDVTCQRQAAVLDLDADPDVKFTNYVRQVNYFLTAAAVCEAGEAGGEQHYRVAKTVYSALLDGD